MTVDEALAQADLRVRVVSEGNPFYDIHAAVMSDEALAVLSAVVRKGLDYKHHSSCGHAWTMRHTACPECFAALRQRHAEAVAVLDAAQAHDSDITFAAPKVWIQVDRAAWDRWLAAKARLA